MLGVILDERDALAIGFLAPVTLGLRLLLRFFAGVSGAEFVETT